MGGRNTIRMVSDLTPPARERSGIGKGGERIAELVQSQRAFLETALCNRGAVAR